MRLLRSSYADRPPRSPTGWGPVRAGGGKTTWIGLVACACTLLAMACANPVAKPAHPEGGAASGQTAAPLVLSVVGTNDLHGHLETLPVLSGYVANLRTRRAEAGGAVLLLDAGDMFQGTLASNLAEGQPVIEAYNHLGYAAVAIGNHEFDFGPEGPAALSTSPTENARGALFARARQARFPFLSANVVEEGSGQALDADNVFPSRLLRIGAVNVGVVGVTTEATPRSTLARNFAGLRVTALADAIIAEAQALREAAAEVVIVLAHAGAACQHLDDPKAIDSCRPEAEIFDVARALPPGLVDGIVAGHTHAGVAHEINGIPIIEAFAYGRAFGRFDLVLNARTRRPERHQIFPPQDLCRPRQDIRADPCVPYAYEGRAVQLDDGLVRIVARAEEEVRPMARQPLGTIAQAPIARAYDRESALGNLFADLMRAARPHADVALINGGGLRQDLPAGPLTYEHLFEAMPFDNTFAQAHLTVGELALTLARNLERQRGFLSVSGVSVEARCEGRKVSVKLLQQDGTPLPDERELSVVTNDFLATGGDGSFGGTPFVIEPSPTIRDEMARILRGRAEPLHPADLYDPAHPRTRLPRTTGCLD